MRVTLMNFGDANRVIHDSNNQPVIIGIGKYQECELKQGTYDFIRKSQDSDTLMLIPNRIEMPNEIIEVLDTLADIDSTQYDQLLRTAFSIFKYDNAGRRPSRNELRIELRAKAAKYCRDFVAGKFTPQDVHAVASAIEGAQDQPFTKDDVNPKELEREQRASKPKKKLSARKAAPASRKPIKSRKPAKRSARR